MCRCGVCVNECVSRFALLWFSFSFGFRFFFLWPKTVNCAQLCCTSFTALTRRHEVREGNKEKQEGNKENTKHTTTHNTDKRVRNWYQLPTAASQSDSIQFNWIRAFSTAPLAFFQLHHHITSFLRRPPCFVRCSVAPVVGGAVMSRSLILHCLHLRSMVHPQLRPHRHSVQSSRHQRRSTDRPRTDIMHPSRPMHRHRMGWIRITSRSRSTITSRMRMRIHCSFVARPVRLVVSMSSTTSTNCTCSMDTQRTHIRVNSSYHRIVHHRL